MHKYVIRYTKEGDAKYISHLDFLRALGRAMRRAGLPIKYSEGFNPHPCLSFAQPLGVGITGENEWFEAEFTALCEDIPARLSAVMPRGIRILDAILVEKNRFSALSRADYLVAPQNKIAEKDLQAFLAREEIIIEKKTKSGVKPTDIRPMIFEAKLVENGVFLRVSAGSSVNLKPQTVMDAIEKYTTDYAPGFCRYTRLALLDEENQPLY